MVIRTRYQNLLSGQLKVKGTHIFTDGLSIFSLCFFKYTQNNPEYLIQNTIHQAIQIYHSMLVLIF